MRKYEVRNKAAETSQNFTCCKKTSEHAFRFEAVACGVRRPKAKTNSTYNRLAAWRLALGLHGERRL